jgi:3-dehydroquinate dehydratase/shikimate dehydrogenase
MTLERLLSFQGSWRLPTPMALVVETVTGATTAELRAARDAAAGDLVELRLDTVADPDVAGALQGRRKPVIVTCRPAWEGGHYVGDEPTRLDFLREAARRGAEFVDVEFAADWRRVSVGANTQLVISSHDFARMPADLATRLAAMRATGADLVKIAVRAERLADCIALRDAARRTGADIAIAMGPAGVISRTCPWLFGSSWTYGGRAAPGQLPARMLVERYRVRRGSPATAVYGVAGAPLAHSASPAMHNAAFAAIGLDAVFTEFETDDAAELLDVVRAFGVRGASVTAPLKTGLAPLVPTDAEAAAVGAINTLRCAAGRCEGRNFDLAGFLAPLDRRGYQLSGRRATVLGAGGAARSVAAALASRGAIVTVSARRADRAAALASDLGVATAEWPPPASWDLLVHTTPVGTAPRVGDAPLAVTAAGGKTVYDLVYNPRRTALLEAARAAGAETIDGLEMLLAQAGAQFEWWTGQPAPVDVMTRAAEAFLDQTEAEA